MLNDIENVVFGGQNIVHSITKLHFDEPTKTLLIVVTPYTETEFNKVRRTYIFKGVKNFEYELDPNENFEAWPRSIIGMDYYPGRIMEKWNTVINCGDIEFTFFAPELPALVEAENA
jgi:hypothetical protein